jgi:hypothetical protein
LTPGQQDYLNTRRSSPACEVNPTPNDSFRPRKYPPHEKIAAQQKAALDQTRLSFFLGVVPCG